jgi:tetratricopeptide (TPR) repeat protein
MGAGEPGASLSRGDVMRIQIFLLLSIVPFAAVAATPAEVKIEQAKASIAREPGKPTGYSSLAMALSARARETAKSELYEEALRQTEQSLALQPENFEAMKASAWALLGLHRFAEALSVAEKINRQVPDDVQVYGFIADASIELGNYEAAENAAQWMLDLRPGNVPGLTRGAYLRELYGDIDGALDFMQQAFQRIQAQEVEDRAWVLTHIAHLRLLKGEIDVADRVLKNALTIFPNYHYALGKLAKVRMVQNRHEDAVKLMRKRYEVAPHPENLFEVAVALIKAGRTAEARAVFTDFEESARKEMNGPDNANRELIFYYLDDGNNAKEALRIASQEIRIRKDVHTIDAYAWALHRAGKTQEAGAEIEKAVAVGVRDPQILQHASTIRKGAAQKIAAQ